METVLSNDGIRVATAERCPTCGLFGDVAHGELTDRLFGAPGIWSIRECRDRSCGSVWLDPQPLNEDIPKLYERYYTHVIPDDVDPNLGAGSKSQAKRAILRESFGYDRCYPAERLSVAARSYTRLPFLRDRIGRHVFWLKAIPGGRLLDFGCGSGRFMKRMRRMGWNPVGYEPDPHAASVGQELLGLPVVSGDLGAIAQHEEPFDAIVLSHVIEHLVHPTDTLRRLAKLLKPSGQMVVVTPNYDCFGRTYFGSNWRGLEPPRHLQLFREKSLTACVTAAGLKIDRVFSVAAAAQWMWFQGTALKRGGHDVGLIQEPSTDRMDRLKSRAFEAIEHLLLAVGSNGEEIVAIARQ